jgi:predicted PurR-regulated permease PerM
LVLRKTYSRTRRTDYAVRRMSEQRQEKKVVSRTVAIALGIICIVLAVILVGAIMNYTSMVSDLTDKVNLAKFVVWENGVTTTQDADSYTNWLPLFSASYAGYVSVWVQTSTTSNTYVRVIYSSHDVYYDNQVSVGTHGIAVFPILPSSNIDIRIGNTNQTNGATEIVTITYYY